MRRAREAELQEIGWKERAEPFLDLREADLGPLMDRIGDAQVVLIGEATHGTSEFYRMRARITQRLIEEKGFTIVAVEADWPDAERIDAYVRWRESKPAREWDPFSRFPDWMWRNEEVLNFVEWLRGINRDREPDDRAGFYGLDLYSMVTSVEEVISYLRERDEELAEVAKSRYRALLSYQKEAEVFRSAALRRRSEAAEDGAVEMLVDLLKRRLDLIGEGGDGESFFEANLASQFDEYIWMDETRAVTPLGERERAPSLPRPHPFSLTDAPKAP